MFWDIKEQRNKGHLVFEMLIKVATKLIKAKILKIKAKKSEFYFLVFHSLFS